MKITLSMYKKIIPNICNGKKFQVPTYNCTHFFITSKLNKNLKAKTLFFIKKWMHNFIKILTLKAYKQYYGNAYNTYIPYT